MKIFNNSKECKKLSGKFLLVWAKNHWGLKFIEKILKYIWKIEFLSIFYPHLPGLLSFYTALENNTIFLQQFFRFRGRGGSFPPAGVPDLNKHRHFIETT